MTITWGACGHPRLEQRPLCHPLQEEKECRVCYLEHVAETPTWEHCRLREEWRGREDEANACDEPAEIRPMRSWDDAQQNWIYLFRDSDFQLPFTQRYCPLTGGPLWRYIETDRGTIVD